MKRNQRQAIFGIKRKKAPNRVNKARSAREFARCYHSVERKAFVKELPSCVSGHGPCVNAHIKGDGGSRKADYRFIVPLTDLEHRTLHAMQPARFQAVYGVDLDQAAAETERAWKQFSGEQE